VNFSYYFLSSFVLSVCCCNPVFDFTFQIYFTHFLKRLFIKTYSGGNPQATQSAPQNQGMFWQNPELLNRLSNS